MLNQIYPYELPPLPYEYDALEPYIDTETMRYHHDAHFKNYIGNLNSALEPHPDLQKLTLVQLLRRARALPADLQIKILRNGGGVYNHSLFFDSLSPADTGRNIPTGEINNQINTSFGSFDSFKKAFSEQALAVFGSGWTYLVGTSDGRLKIVNLKNQETPVAINAYPVLPLDVWEHAYYLKYKNKRADYIDAIWNVFAFPQF